MSLLRRPATDDHPWPAGKVAPVDHPQRLPRSSTGQALHDLRWLTVLPVGAVAALLVLSAVAPATAERVALPVAVVGALLGIPHGAVDHLVPWWWGAAGDARPASAGANRRVAAFGTFLVLYTLVAAVALVALLRFPTPTLLVFFLLSAAHFGRGEVLTAAERAGRCIPRATQDRWVAAAFGSAVVGLLFWARPARTNPLLGPLSPWLADAAVRTRTLGLVAVAVLVVLGVGTLVRDRRHLEAAELSLIAITFAVAPPLAAFGVYFGGWHAVRHTGRLLDLARSRRRELGHRDARWSPAGKLLLRSAALPTVAALSTVLALWLLRDLASFQAEVGVLLALTFPHAGVVWALDRQQAAGGARAGA